uniref:Uncharacterized protein n=1 Tax=Manihot esculenta TaxID=3983 RepID=A0A2C9U3W7_MANES
MRICMHQTCWTLYITQTPKYFRDLDKFDPLRFKVNSPARAFNL